MHTSTNSDLRDVCVEIFSLMAPRPGSPHYPCTATIKAATLGDIIAGIPHVFPFSLSPCLDKQKYWLVNSDISYLNGKIVDLHFIEKREHLLVRDKADRYTCPKHDPSAVIPAGAIVHIGHLVC